MSKAKSPLSQITVSSIILYAKRHTYLTVAAVSWLVMVALAIFFVVPQAQRILAQRTQLDAATKKLVEISARVRFLQALDAQELETQRQLLQTVLPSVKPVIPLISSMEKLAADAGVSLKNFELNPGSVATDSSKAALTKSFVAGVGSLPLKLEAQGGFSQMNVFFKSLDTLVPLINVKTIDFTQLAQNVKVTDDSTQYKSTVELESLYALQEAAAPKAIATAALTPLTIQDRELIASLSAQVSTQTPAAGPAFTVPTSTSSGTRSTIFSF